MDRPKLNALDVEMIDMLSHQLKVCPLPHGTHLCVYVFTNHQEWDNAELCEMIIGRGAGRAFCAGGNVKGLQWALPV